MRVRQIKIFYIFVPNLGEIYLSVKKKNCFFSKTKTHLASWQPKGTDLTVKNGIFVKIWQ